MENQDQPPSHNTYVENLMNEVRMQRVANLQTLLLMARFDVPILRDIISQGERRADR